MPSSTTLIQKVAARRAQSALWCRACGGEGKLIAGYCSRCYARRHWDKRYFSGLRAQVLERDGHACQLCIRPAQDKRSIVVHHRRPGISKVPSLISLCPACHARLHRTRVLPHRSTNSLLHAMLWRELHPGGPEQLALGFDGPALESNPATRPVQTLELALG